ncbi:EthD domain-containing protein [Hypomontagnella submonticulosa]|nr:EthD domain-containing protein [Hypomontagnella submonticulosa]
MPFVIIFFATRKPGVTPEQFKTHYEDIHMPLLREIAGPHFPLTHTRRYIQRSPGVAEGTTLNATTPAQVLVGTQADFDYDVVVELTFEDAATFQAFMAYAHTPERSARVIADEETFLDRSQSRAVVLGDINVTKRD